MLEEQSCVGVAKKNFLGGCFYNSAKTQEEVPDTMSALSPFSEIVKSIASLHQVKHEPLFNL